MLARRYYPEIYYEMARLITDPEVSPRLAAASVLAALGSECGNALMMMRVLTGEQDPMVLRKCFSGHIAAHTDRLWSFATGYLDSADLVLAENVAIAVGESNDKCAFPVLRETWERNLDKERKSTLLLAMALTRDDDAVEYLLSMIKEAHAPEAARALQAISIYSADERLHERVREAISSRKEREVIDAYEMAFSG
jgi:HEAT repeat protein